MLHGIVVRVPVVTWGLPESQERFMYIFFAQHPFVRGALTFQFANSLNKRGCFALCFGAFRSSDRHILRGNKRKPFSRLGLGDVVSTHDSVGGWTW